MTLTELVEGALPSQEMRQAFFHEGWTDLKYSDDQEKRLQPASYEPGIEDKCWRVPDGFYPEPGVSVMESLRRINPREWPEQKISGDDGVVAFRDFSYLFPLEGNWNIPPNFFLRASPKSTEGRMGNLVRVVADGISNYDDIRGPFEGKLYVLVKPLVFNNRVSPGFSFTQLRAYCKNQAILSDTALLRLINQRQLVSHDGAPLSTKDVKVDHGLVLTADLQGEKSNGVVGFKARENPEPVDRRNMRFYDWDQYFDALLAPQERKYDLKKGDFVLVQSWEWVEMTDTHAGVMDDYRTSMMENRAHIAGYFDANKFSGVATLEIPVTDAMPLWHRKAMCSLKFEEMRAIPDKEYKGAHQGQKFALMPKPMKLPDSAEISRKVKSENELIMYVERAKLLGNDHFEGFRPVEQVDYRSRILKHHDFGIKGDGEKGLEADPSCKQPIAYTVFVDPKKKEIFAYQRGSSKTVYSEARLFDNWSIGLGGHVRPEDKSANPVDPVLASLLREVHKEEVEHTGSRSDARLLGYINADNARPVDAVHFGLLHVVEMDGTVRPKDAELKKGSMIPITKFRDMMNDKRYNVEVWSRIAFDVIEKMYG